MIVTSILRRILINRSRPVSVPRTLRYSAVSAIRIAIPDVSHTYLKPQGHVTNIYKRMNVVSNSALRLRALPEASLLFERIFAQPGEVTCYLAERLDSCITRLAGKDRPIDPLQASSPGPVV